ncbi:MAG: aminopeptidase P family protein [Hyphomicrobium sp.]
MFQSFHSASDPSLVAPRVVALRALLVRQKLDAFLVPRADEHQGEYVAPSAERLKWLTGFSGSAGLAAVTRKDAALFVDGRYTTQSRAETDTEQFELPGIARVHLSRWLKEKLPKDAVVGFDPWLHTAGEIARLAEALKPKGITLKPVSRNPVDAAWGKARPSPPQNPIVPHPLKYAGRSSSEKLGDIQKRLAEDGQGAVVLTLPDSICWVFNIRGSDVAHNPVLHAFAVIPASGKAELYVAPEKVTRDTKAHLEPVAKLLPPDALMARVKALGKGAKRVRLDPESAAYALSRALGPKAAAKGSDPCIALKATKNAIEAKGSRAAHLRDGVAMARFLAWLDAESPSGRLDEITAVEKLEAFRAETGALKEISFDTISGSGPNGAIVHYRVTEKTNRTLTDGELFLIDSGAQYLDGTTDITRTVAIGTPSETMRERFTLVLKGHIAIAVVRFPKGTRGIDLDPFARRALWENGLDYDHGTGHGVGSYLSVHEGPQSISRAGMAELVPGMILSNEPGYYLEGAYGIRIESLVLVTEPVTPPGGDRPVMGFETLTLAPIDLRLIAKELLSPSEIQWLDAYHARVRELIGPHLDDGARAWLNEATGRL